MASIKEQLARIALKKVKLSNGETLEETMAREANRLYDCIQYYIDRYYNDKKNDPLVYERTYRYQGALYAEDIVNIRVVGDTLRIGVGFHNDLAMHRSLSSLYIYDHNSDGYWIPMRNQHESNAALLMEMGWYAPRLASIMGGHIYRLTYFEGIGAVADGIRDFNRSNPLHIKINADDFYNGKAY